MSIYEDIKTGLEQAIEYERQSFGKQEGWICPVCGRGVAPWADYCPCQGSEMKITYGTSTGEDIFSPIPMRVFDLHTCKYHTEYPPGWKVGNK